MANNIPGALWGSQAKSVVRASYYASEIQREEARKTAAAYRLHMMMDDWEEPLTAELRRRFPPVSFLEVSKYTNTTHNLFKNVINRISKVYNKSPRRHFVGSVQDTQIIQNIYKRIKIDQKWKKINRYVNAVNDVLLQVIWRNSDIDVDILTPNVVTIIQNEVNPTIADAVIVENILDDTVGGTDGQKFYYWDNNRHYITDKSGYEIQITGNENMINPYGILPFVFIHRTLPDLNFWDESSGEDLYDATIIVGLRNTLLDYYFFWNSFRQLYIVSEDKLPEGMTLSPSAVLQVNSIGATIGVLDFKTAFDQLRSDLNSYAGGLLQSYGISLDTYSENRPVEYSGKALRIKNEFLQSLWDDQLLMFEDAELDLLNMIKKVYQVHTGKILNVGIEKINYPPMMAYYSDDEQLTIDERKISNGFVDAAEIFARWNNMDDITLPRAAWVAGVAGSLYSSILQ